MGSNRGPSLQSIKIHGKFTAKLKTSTNVIEENIYVIDNLQKTLNGETSNRATRLAVESRKYWHYGARRILDDVS